MSYDPQLIDHLAEILLAVDRLHEVPRARVKAQATAIIRFLVCSDAHLDALMALSARRVAVTHAP